MSSTELSLRGLESITGGFQSYLNYAYGQPILSEQEERELFSAYSENNDLESVRKIVLSHLRFVVFIAKGYMGYGLPMEDLVQEGSVGLMKSVKRFDLNYGVRFASFAVHWIKAEIQEYVIRNWKLVKVATTKAQRKLFFNLSSIKKKIGWMSQEEVKEVASYLDVEEKDVSEMESRLRQADEFFDESFGDSKDGVYVLGSASSKLLADTSSCPEQSLMDEDFRRQCMTNINEFASSLDDRSKDILFSRWLVKDESGRASLKTLAERHCISIERVRKIESRVIMALKSYLENRGLSMMC